MTARPRISRIGFIYPAPNPMNEANWSGTPRALASALRTLGIELVPVSYRLPKIARGLVLATASVGGRGAIARGSRLQTEARTRVLARELTEAQPVDAALALGTDLFELERVVPRGLPVATYDDGTFVQFMRHPDSDVRRRGYPPRDVSRWSRRQAAAARRATACCVSTSWAARSMIDDYGVPAGHVHVVGIGHRPRPGSGRRRDWRTPRFLFVGADWQRKNGDAVVSAFTNLRAEHPEAVLEIVGDHPPLEIENVRTHGFLPRDRRDAQAQLDMLFDSATAFVLPSRFDPAGIAYLEAASAGLPVIATTEGGAGELLGNAAIAVHPDDRDALLEAMRRLTDPAESERLGRMAQQAAARSTWTAVAKRIVEALELWFPQE